MNKLEWILVGHDLKEGGNSAARSAAEFAKRCGAQVRLVHVVEPYQFYQLLSHPLTPPYATEDLVQQAGERLQILATTGEYGLVRVEYEVRTGKPFIELILARRAWQADLVVVGSGQGQERFLGSTSERVLRKAMVPVLVAKRPLQSEPKTVLVPIDYSACAKKAAEEALAVVRHFGGRIVFLHVIDIPPAYTVGYAPEVGSIPPVPLITPAELAAEWDHFLSALSALDTVSWEKHTREGHPASVIAEEAERHRADLIVMGTHGRTGLTHMLLGSVAEGVVRTTACPVLTIRPDAFQFQLP
jgi:nucleotide-binding universal stress UspA family protein